MLTKTQGRLLGYIERAIAVDGTPPTFDQMREAMGLRSKSGIHRLLESLEERGFVRRVRNRAQAIEVLRPPPPSVDGVPVLGRVGSGSDVSAWSAGGRHVVVPGLPAEGHFALVVGGDSMDGAGILDGDVAVLRRQGVAAAGDVVAAVVGGEALLRRYARHGAEIELAAANPAHPTLRLPARQVSLRGRLAALLRGVLRDGRL